MDIKGIKGQNSELIKRTITFNPPPHDVIVKITDRISDVVIDSAEVVENGDYVLVTGYLNKSVVYDTINKKLFYKLIGQEDSNQEDNDEEDEQSEDNINEKKGVKCEDTNPKLQSIAIDGVVRHATAWIPFEILISVLGANEDDEVVIEGTSVKSLNVNDELVEDGLIKGIEVNDVVEVSISTKQQC